MKKRILAFYGEWVELLHGFGSSKKTLKKRCKAKNITGILKNERKKGNVRYKSRRWYMNHDIFVQASKYNVQINEKKKEIRADR